MSEGAFTEKRIQLLMHMSHKKVHTELQRLRDSVSNLREEIASLKQVQPVAPATSAQPTVASQEEQASASSDSHQQSSAAPGGQRYGNYTSDDVAIDQIFYFGNK